MITKLILENEHNIEKFNIDYYLENKLYSIAAALSALETTNEIQKHYFKTEASKDCYAENVMRLYALLQSLFVSIDSLYSLAYGLTKSKSFININKNPDLRDLKYIRNDVVGHPANRVYSSSTLAYCILDNKSIGKFEFSYHIYTGQGIERVRIDLNKIVNSYYIECNNLLNVLYNIANDNSRLSKIITLSSQIIDVYLMNGDYYKLLKELKTLYLNKYPDATAAQHRIIWRLEIIEDLKKYQSDDEDIMDLAQYAIGLELIRIYQLLSGKLHKISLSKRTPFLVSSFYRFLNKNRTLVQHINKINDIKNPLFKSSVDALLKVAVKKNISGPIRYLRLLEKLYMEKEDNLLYGFALPIKDYKKK